MASQTATGNATVSPYHHQGGNPPGYRDPLEQAIDWQRALNRARDAAPKDCVPLAQGARAWIEAERLKREIRMQPKPRPIDVQLPGKRRHRMQPAIAFDDAFEPAKAPESVTPPSGPQPVEPPAA